MCHWLCQCLSGKLSTYDIQHWQSQWHTIISMFHLTPHRRLARAVCVDQAGQSKTDASQGEDVDGNAFTEQEVVRLSGNRNFCRRC